MSFKVVYGPSCSGKSTYVRENKDDEDVVFDYDRVSNAITYKSAHTTDQRAYAHKFVLDMRTAYINTAKKANHSAKNVWFIISNLTEKFKKFLEDLNPEYILMETTEQECLERLENNETRPDKEKWANVIHEWFKKNEESRGMTPKDKIKFKTTAQTRALPVLNSSLNQKRIDSECYVEGYAAGYEPYVLFYDENGEPIYERFERGCFDKCDMSDIIMQYDHSGKVMARISNGSLIVEADDKGLFTAADLSRTEAARDLYSDIKEEMVTKMSWRFLCGNYYFDKDTRTIVHVTVKKIYDVSAVSIPANDKTEINARSWVNGVIDLAARSEAELEDRRRRLRLKLLLQEEN